MDDFITKHKFTGMSVTLPVTDVKATANWYVSRLGFKPYFYVEGPPERSGVRLGSTEICFCAGEPLKRKDQWVYFDISQPDELFERYNAEGVEVVFEPRDQFWGSRDFAIKDPDGNILVFGDERDKSKAQRLPPDFQSAIRCFQTGDIGEFKRMLHEDPKLATARSPACYDSEREATLLHYLMDCPRGRHAENICEFAQVLIESGANADATDGGNEGNTPLQFLMSINREIAHGVDLTKLLLDAGASATRGNDHHGMDAFTLALLHGQTACAAVMFEWGYPPNFPWAGAGLGKVKLVRAFFGEGDDESLPLDERAENLSEHEAQCRMNCAFLVAAINGQKEVVEFLLAKGMDVDMQPPGSDFAGIGGTALHWAARYGHIETVKALIARGANVLAQDDTYCLTPAGWASWFGMDEPRRFLLAKEQEAAD